MDERVCRLPLRIELEQALGKLPFPATDQWPLGVWDAEVFAQPPVSVSVFAPKRIDFQTAHDHDELYFVVSGSGELTVGRRRYPFVPGDILFVPAGVDHRFTRFGADLVTWAVFFGPSGGAP